MGSSLWSPLLWHRMSLTRCKYAACFHKVQLTANATPVQLSAEHNRFRTVRRWTGVVSETFSASLQNKGMASAALQFAMCNLSKHTSVSPSGQSQHRSALYYCRLETSSLFTLQDVHASTVLRHPQLYRETMHIRRQQFAASLARCEALRCVYTCSLKPPSSLPLYCISALFWTTCSVPLTPQRYVQHETTSCHA